MGSPEACYDNFNGTSAGAPVASGILALVLEAKYDADILDDSDFP